MKSQPLLAGLLLAAGLATATAAMADETVSDPLISTKPRYTPENTLWSFCTERASYPNHGKSHNSENFWSYF